MSVIEKPIPPGTYSVEFVRQKGNYQVWVIREGEFKGRELFIPYKPMTAEALVYYEEKDGTRKMQARRT